MQNLKIYNFAELDSEVQAWIIKEKRDYINESASAFIETSVQDILTDVIYFFGKVPVYVKIDCHGDKIDVDYSIQLNFSSTSERKLLEQAKEKLEKFSAVQFKEIYAECISEYEGSEIILSILIERIISRILGVIREFYSKFYNDDEFVMNFLKGNMENVVFLSPKDFGFWTENGYQIPYYATLKDLI